MPTLIHCTKKLLAELPSSLIDQVATGESWHANVLRIDRRKCVLFTHDATLYSVFVPGLRKPDFALLDQMFGQRLFKALLWEGFPQHLIERALEACRTVRFTRSSSRSVLGSMNDIRFQIEVHVAHASGLTQVDLVDLHQRLNRTLLNAVRYQYPVDGFREHLTQIDD
ncbi:MAG: hypothetical protein IDH49_05780 [Gammaproteobacteria bacterium]|nr:hypothetical protein [Gammaproteobacteria bacterium]